MKNYLEITNLNFDNKGDHLMVEAALLTLSKRIPSAEFCVPFGEAKINIRHRHSFQQTLRSAPVSDKSTDLERRYFRKYLLFKSFIPNSLLISRGFIAPRQVKAVIDISGYSFSDFWGVKMQESLAEYYRNCKKLDQKVILMPKTYGPFSSAPSAAITREVINTTDLVFCRDQRSYEWLEEIGAIGKNVHLAPDYTGAVPGFIPTYAEKYRDRAVIIPNYRMIDRTDTQIADAYVPFLVNAYKYLEKREKKPFILLHATVTDLPLVASLQERIKEKLDVVIEEDPLFIKGIIGQCSSVLSSRLHGIINGLSQNVPTIGCGWAHKYQMVFNEYDCPEMLISDIRDNDEVETKLEILCDEQKKDDLQARMQTANRKIINLNNAMWDLIEQTIVK